MDVLETLKRESAVILGAPWSMLSIAVIVGAAALGLGAWHYSERIETLKERLTASQGDLDGVRTRASNAAIRDGVRIRELVETAGRLRAEGAESPQPAATSPAPPPRTVPTRAPTPGVHVESHEQHGGITAGTVNIGTQEWRLSQDQAVTLRVQLGAVRGNVRVVNAGNSVDFVDDMKAALREAGWSVSSGKATYGDEFSGLRMLADNQSDPAVVALRRALESAGLEAPFAGAGGPSVGPLVIEVGNRPRLASPSPP